MEKKAQERQELETKWPGSIRNGNKISVPKK
jgi:hypothetical protein